MLYGAFCNPFDLHQAIIGLEKQLLVILRVVVLLRFYCKRGQFLQNGNTLNTYKDNKGGIGMGDMKGEGYST